MIALYVKSIIKEQSNYISSETSSKLLRSGEFDRKSKIIFSISL